ncbi:unnamed protein product [Adineta steineri]|uniref:Uncharacterized protein n=1 Tax=Adineta steineri TaxID=433720 RepID=A0A815JLF6_9BILA|nr:unnamed protein product [Adineta steineri]CAF3866106.1 unnamed protein product [Adineta steineri]
MSDNIAPSTDHRISITLPVYNRVLIEKAFSLLKSRRVRRSEEYFLISTETVDHSDMEAYTPLLLEQYAHADDEVKGYLRRLKLNSEGQQFVKAIIVGTKNLFSASLIATSRQKIGNSDQHKILIATTKKEVEMSAPWTICTKWFGMQSKEQKELENVLSELNSEDNKKCLEAMVIHALTDKIRVFLGNDVNVQFIQK